jgi:hypothetical protein
LASLLRDYEPLAIELAQSPEETRARQADARDRLISMYLRQERSGRLEELPMDVRDICERLKSENGGVLPRPRGGRPQDEEHHLLIFMQVQEAIELHGSEQRGIVEALHAVAAKVGRSYEVVRTIYYERRNDPEWLLAARIGRRL